MSSATPGGAKAKYGVDAPMVPLSFAAVTVAGFVLAFITTVPWPWLIIAVVFLLQLASYLYATRRGKFRIWARLLDQLDLHGDERVLDLGCGRGAVLIAVAKRVPRGTVDGVDLWRTADQSGNDEAVTRANTAAEGVSERVTLHTADVGELPFPDASFDLVVSSLVIHNIHDEAHRLTAVSEAVRVLKPGGRIVVVDIKHVPAYATELAARGAVDVVVDDMGPEGWFANPWVRMRAVRATRA